MTNQDAMAAARAVPGLPFSLSPSSGSAWTIADEPPTVRTSAAPHSDIFIDPGTAGQLNAESMLNAVTLLGVPPDGDFQFSARVRVDFASTYDAGVLLVWADDRNWAKLCFEYSPDGEPMVVSVVTREVSDDANAFVVDGRAVWLRVCRIDQAFAYHASLDGQTWHMVRFFALQGQATPAAPTTGTPSTGTPSTGTAAAPAITIGFEAQSPTGEGCEVTFDHITFRSQRLGNLRDGS
jgi:hypothetical protein